LPTNHDQQQPTTNIQQQQQPTTTNNNQPTANNSLGGKIPRRKIHRPKQQLAAGNLDKVQVCSTPLPDPDQASEV